MPGHGLKEPKQKRSVETRRRLLEAAITIIAEEGLTALTHRKLAQTVGCSLALTTYYFPKKADIISAVSEDVLEGYLAGFARVAIDYQNGLHPPKDLWAFSIRVIRASAGRYSQRTATWAEIYLHGVRHAKSRQLVKNWTVELLSSWQRIAEIVEPDFCPAQIQSRIDLVTGLSFMALGLKLTPKQIDDVLLHSADPSQCWKPQSPKIDTTEPHIEPVRSTKASRTQQTILDASVEILKQDGVAALTHARVAKRAGLANSTLCYYFPQISSLLICTQTVFFEQSKARYREAMADIEPKHISLDELVDLTSFILQREVMLFTSESLALYQFWVEAGRQDRIQSILWSTIVDQTEAWRRRLDALDAPFAGYDALLIQALFIGKLIRLLSSGGTVSELASVRQEFMLELRSVKAGIFPKSSSR